MPTATRRSVGGSAFEANWAAFAAGEAAADALDDEDDRAELDARAARWPRGAASSRATRLECKIRSHPKSRTVLVVCTVRQIYTLQKTARPADPERGLAAPR